MNLSNNTILITGGTSGIGLELAKELLALGNTVIVTGRDEAKLQAVKAQLPGVHTVQSDVSDPKSIVSLHQHIVTRFPTLNIVINNAGIMRKVNLHHVGGELMDLTREIETNLCGPTWMVKQFLPHLKQQKNAAIVNVSSGLAFVPLAIAPIYCATKAALHSYTQSLRIQLQNTSVKVFELAPPGTETPLFRGDFTDEDLGGVKGMNVGVLAKHAIKGLQRDVYEIRPGVSNVLHLLSRLAPAFILKQLGKSADRMLSANHGETPEHSKA